MSVWGGVHNSVHFTETYYFFRSHFYYFICYWLHLCHLYTLQPGLYIYTQRQRQFSRWWLRDENCFDLISVSKPQPLTGNKLNKTPTRTQHLVQCYYEFMSIVFYHKQEISYYFPVCLLVSPALQQWQKTMKLIPLHKTKHDSPT